MKFYMNEIQTPIYLNSNFIYDPSAYSLSHYKERSIFQSNVVEFWAPITNLVIPGVIPGRYFVSSWGNTWNTKTQSPIGLSLHKKGYWQSHFSAISADGKSISITRKIHVIIMKTFCWFPDCNQYIINHMDTNKQNNNLYNLEWCTESENTIHAIQNGVKKIFNNTESTVYLTDEQVGMIYDLYNNQLMNMDQILSLPEFEGIDINPITFKNICNKRCRLSYFKRVGLL